MPTVLELVDASRAGAGAGTAAPAAQPRTLRHVSELGAGETAAPGVLDGRSLVRALDRGWAGAAAAGAAEEAAAAEEEAEDALHVHYCGARVSALRLGRFKAHFTTAAWEDDDGQTLTNP